MLVTARHATPRDVTNSSHTTVEQATSQTSCHTCHPSRHKSGRVVSPTWTSHITHINEWYHSHERVTSLTGASPCKWKRHAPQITQTQKTRAKSWPRKTRAKRRRKRWKRRFSRLNGPCTWRQASVRRVQCRRCSCSAFLYNLRCWRVGWVCMLTQRSWMWSSDTPRHCMRMLVRRRCVAACCSVLQCVAWRRQMHADACWCFTGDSDSLEHTATHCNTLQHAATHCNIWAFLQSAE